jgi:hypothetical protein
MKHRLMPIPPRAVFCAFLLSHVAGCVHGSGTNGLPEFGLNRIVHGWTNYSTAFNATHDTAAAGDYATVASFYAPLGDVVPLDYAVILISGESRPPNFSRFQFRVFVWSDLNKLIQNPKQGDVANWSYAAPTGGNTIVPDSRTRGGRAAYELRFALSNSPVVLSNGHSYLVGFAARTDTQNNGELFVPTSSHDGPSDVQAGDLVVGGWHYLVNAGGSTVYSGQLAVELIVAPRIVGPPIRITREGNFIRLSWPASTLDFVLEYSLSLPPSAEWFPVEEAPFERDGMKQVLLPATLTRQWFRLHR